MANLNMQKTPKHHALFIAVNIMIFFTLLGGWLIYHMVVDNFAFAGF